MSDRSSEGVPRNVPADSASPVETSGERFRRKGHQSGLYLYAFFTVALLVCLVALAVANTHQVEFSWVVGSSTVPLVWIVIFTAILGWLLGIVTRWSSAGARGREATTEAPLLRDLAAWTDQQPPQHVRHEPYDDEDEEYLYDSQAHSVIMHRPELSRKPLVGERGALRAISCIPVEGEPDYYRMEESEHDGSLDWLGTVSRPIVLSFDGNHWNRSVGPETEHVPHSGDRQLLENQFFGSNKVHRLRDAFLDHSFEV